MSAPAASFASPARYRWLVIAMITLVYMVAQVDRTLLWTIGEAVKRDLGLTNAQLGLLQGFAFTLLYVVVGVPMARVVERRSRVAVLSISVALWSLATAFSGLARGFLSLFLARVLVGVGESGTLPASHSLIGDYFPARERTRAGGIYYLGSPIGLTLGAVAGGWIAQHYGWRAAFLAIGLPGLAVAGLFALIIREPPRGYADKVPDDEPAPPFLAVARQLLGSRAFLHMVLGNMLCTFININVQSFSGPFLIRTFGLNYSQAGLALGLTLGITTGVGLLLGGWLTDLGAARRKAWYGLVPAIGMATVAPLYALAFIQPSLAGSVVCLALGALFSLTYIAPGYTVLHGLLRPRMRASGVAMLQIISNIGAMLGPWCLGLLIDRLLVGQMGGTPGALSHGRCASAAEAGAQLAQACATALAQSTRTALLIDVALMVWPVTHFLLATKHLARELDAAEAARLTKASGGDGAAQAD